jgi:hypothetical protein
LLELRELPTPHGPDLCSLRAWVASNPVAQTGAWQAGNLRADARSSRGRRSPYAFCGRLYRGSLVDHVREDGTSSRGFEVIGARLAQVRCRSCVCSASSPTELQG